MAFHRKLQNLRNWCSYQCLIYSEERPSQAPACKLDTLAQSLSTYIVAASLFQRITRFLECWTSIVHAWSNSTLQRASTDLVIIIEKLLVLHLAQKVISLCWWDSSRFLLYWELHLLVLAWVLLAHFVRNFLEQAFLWNWDYHFAAAREVHFRQGHFCCYFKSCYCDVRKARKCPRAMARWQLSRHCGLEVGLALCLNNFWINRSIGKL